jgi:hypothetical protein
VVFRIDEGIEVGAIENQTVHIQLAGRYQTLSERLANGGDLFLSQEFHVVPEARSRKLCGGKTQPTQQRGAAEPRGHLQFAGRRQAAVDGGHQHVLTKRRALVTFGGVLIDEFDQTELLGEVIEGSDTAKLRETSTGRLRLGLLKALEQGIGRAQVLHDDRTRSSVHAPRLDEVVVGASMDDLALEAGHDI